MMNSLKQLFTGWTAIVLIVAMAVGGVLLGGVMRKLLWGGAVVAAIYTGYNEIFARGG